MDGKCVVVTGASRGLGASVARAFTEAGASVVGCARNQSELERAFEDVSNAEGIEADVRDEDHAWGLVDYAAREHGEIDVLVANAGVNHGNPGEMALPEESYETFDDTMATNLRGTFATVKETLPRMPADGRVLVPSGSVAREPTGGMGAYAVSKAAAEGLVRGFAADAEQAVGVVDPGTVATEVTGGRGRDPEEVAEMFVWAARDVASENLDGEVLDLKSWKKATR
ncbi:short-chain dehydrogenase [Halobacteriales archaeon QS_8_65_32]|nr:MAG: short-chain dehydrogenase [Halobacteriales archaeon QS_8_65_32]